jgi:hypothetical protein
MHLQGFRLLILIMIRRRRGRSRSVMPHEGLVTSLGGVNIIMPSLGALLVRGFHDPEGRGRVKIRHMKIVKKNIESRSEEVLVQKPSSTGQVR